MKIKFELTVDVVDEVEGDVTLDQHELEELAEEIQLGITNSFKKVPWATEEYNSILLRNVEVLR